MPENLNAKSQVMEQTIEVTITRADGTRENLGAVSYYHKSWWRRALWKLKQAVKEIRRGKHLH